MDIVTLQAARAAAKRDGNATYAKVLSSNGTGDQTARINDALAAPVTTGLRKTVRLVGAFTISSPIIVSSLTTIDARDAIITLAPGSNCNMINNFSVSPLRVSLSDAQVTAGGNTVVSVSAAFTDDDIGRSIAVSDVSAPGSSNAYGRITAVSNGVATISGLITNTQSNGNVSIYNRDTSISIIGGTWARGSNSGSFSNTHTMRFRRVDGLVLRDVTVTSKLGKYAISIGDASDYLVDHPIFNNHSDGVHIHGPAVGGRILKPYGYTGDDMVAFTAKDWDTYNDVFGDIVGCEVESIYQSGGLACLKIISGTGTKVRSLNINGVHGLTTIRPICIADDLSGPTDVDAIRISGVTAMPTNADQAQVRLYPTLGRNISIDGITWRAGVSAAPTTGYLALVQINNNSAWDSVTIKNATIVGATDNVSFVSVAGTAQVSDLAVEEYRALGGPTNCHVVNSQGGTLIKRLSQRRGRVLWASSGSTGSLCVGGGDVLRSTFQDIYAENGNGLRNTLSSTVRSFVRMSNVELQGGGLGGFMVDVARPVDVDFANCEGSISTAIVRVTGTNGSASVRGECRNSRAKAGIARDASQSIRVRSLSYEADVSLLARSAGDQAYNTNASLSCGVGPVICDGTNWKHLFTAATY